MTSPTSLTSDHEEHYNVKTVSIPSAHPRAHHTRKQSTGSLKEHIAEPASPPGSERESEPGSTTEDDEEEEDTSEVEPEEDIEEVRHVEIWAKLFSEPDMLLEGGEKDSVIRRFGKGLPPYVTLLFFGLPTHVDGPLFAHHSSSLSCIRPAALCLPTLCSFCLTAPSPNQQLLHYSASHDIRTPQVYPILYYDTLPTSCRVLIPLSNPIHPLAVGLQPFFCRHVCRTDSHPPSPFFICPWASFRRF